MKYVILMAKPNRNDTAQTHCAAVEKRLFPSRVGVDTSGPFIHVCWN